MLPPPLTHYSILDVLFHLDLVGLHLLDKLKALHIPFNDISWEDNKELHMKNYTCFIANALQQRNRTRTILYSIKI